jgi:hypothetical protein
MPIPLKLATADTPEPWHAVEEARGLDYAREGLPSAPRRSILRTLWAIMKRLAGVAGILFGGVLLVIAFALVIAGTIIRFAFTGSAAILLMLRRAGPGAIYERLRYGGRVPVAQVVA